MDSRTQVLDDPFWSVVAARHPDLDIVLLPAAAGDPEPDLATPVFDATAEQVAEIVELVEGYRPAFGLAPDRHAEVVAGPAPDTVEVRLKHSGPDPAGAQVLALIESAADRARRTEGPVVRVSATFDLVRVQATWAQATEVLVVRVTSPALRVGTDLAARLLGRA